MEHSSPAPRRTLGRRLLIWGGGGVMLLVAALVGFGLYFRSTGVPETVVRRLEQEAQSRGVVVQFGAIHLRGWRTLIAENVHVRLTNAPPGAELVLSRVELQIKKEDRKGFRLRLDSLQIDGGQLVWPAALSNAPPRELRLTEIHGELRSSSPDQWQLHHLTSRWLGTEIQLSGSITNAASLRDWPWPKRPAAKPSTQFEIGEWLARAEELRLKPASVLEVKVNADGRDPQSLQAQLRWRIAQATWRDTALHNFYVRAATAALPGTAGTSKIDFELQFDRGITAGASLRLLSLNGELTGAMADLSLRDLRWKLQLAGLQLTAATGTDLVVSAATRPSNQDSMGGLETDLALGAALLETPWFRASSNHAQTDVVHGTKSSDPWHARWQLTTGRAESRWGEAAQLQLSGLLAPRAGALPAALTNQDLGLWAKLAPFEADWRGEVSQITSPKLASRRVAVAGTWRSPEMMLPGVHAELYERGLDASALLNATNRQLQVSASLDFDVHKVDPLLTVSTRKWLSQFTWETPPKVQADLQLQMPAWTNAQPNWREEVMPSITLSGQFAATNGAFRKIPITRASSHFSLTNLTWRLPDLYVRRNDAEANLEYAGHMGTHEYHWRVKGRANPQAFKPLLQLETQTRVLDQFDFPMPPYVEGEVWGRWQEPESVRFTGRLAATNFLFRGERCSRLAGDLRLTENSLQFSDVLVAHDDQEIFVPAGSLDLTERVVYVTNAVSTMEPDLVTRVIGPRVRAALAPYRFPVPPAVRLSGRLPTTDVADADVRFEVAADQMQYWKLNLSNVSGTVYWRGDILSIADMQSGFYGGGLRWHGEFDFSVPVGAKLAFEGQFQNADFHALMSDILPRTNRLEGSLDARVTITSASSDDWRSWQGTGRLRLRDGFLWDIPIFGFFSPVLNTLAPGLGKSRVSAGDAHFKIDESVVRTSDLELKSPALRLLYTGSVDLKGKVDARMQAEILRDAWGVGRFLSWAFWPISKAFEYRITGTVSHPKSQPVFIPRALLWAFHPMRALKRVFVPGKSQSDNPFAEGLPPFPSIPGAQAEPPFSGDQQEHAQPERDPIPAERDEGVSLDEPEKPTDHNK